MPNFAIDFNTENADEQHNKVVTLLKTDEGESFVFCRGQLLSSYDRGDLYARNYLIVQLFLRHKISQRILSEVFELTVPHISMLVGKYRRAGSAGIEDNTVIRLNNNQKIKGKVADHIVKQMEQEKTKQPSYKQLAKSIKKKFEIRVSSDRVGNWWRAYKKYLEEEKNKTHQQQLPLIEENTKGLEQEAEALSMHVGALELPPTRTEIKEGEWQENAVAGSFILYSMLSKSQFLQPFLDQIKGVLYSDRKHVERVMLTLFFMQGLRLKSIEQTKHLSEKHFGPLVLGPFCRGQSLRYAIDDITAHENFDEAMSLHYKNMATQTNIGDEIYYTDGHFSCYYGKHPIPKGYDARRKQASRGRNTVYLHNSKGHNILSFESPTNTTLNVDIETLLEKMEEAFGDVKCKTLFFDRGGFSAKCFTALKKKGMYFTTYLKHRKKEAEIDSSLFTEVEVEINGEMIRNRIFEKSKQTKKYGELRTLLFIGKQEKQIPVITTNLELSAAEIVAYLQKRWVEENGFKFMGEHYNIDLLTTYKIEQAPDKMAPDKIMARVNPARKEINRLINSKKTEIEKLKSEYSTRVIAIKEKTLILVSELEEQEEQLLFAIKNAQMELGLLELKRQDIPCKISSNLKDESVISQQKRRMFINLVKAMNYNSEKWLQELFCQHHPKKDETLSLIRYVLKAPGRVRKSDELIEVELDRLDNKVQANSLHEVLDDLSKYNYLRVPDGRRLKISQAF